jgi:hypothetical protein
MCDTRASLSSAHELQWNRSQQVRYTLWYYLQESNLDLVYVLRNDLAVLICVASNHIFCHTEKQVAQLHMFEI